MPKPQKKTCPDCGSAMDVIDHEESAAGTSTSWECSNGKCGRTENARANGEKPAAAPAAPTNGEKVRTELEIERDCNAAVALAAEAARRERSAHLTLWSRRATEVDDRRKQRAEEARVDRDRQRQAVEKQYQEDQRKAKGLREAGMHRIDREHAARMEAVRQSAADDRRPIEDWHNDELQRIADAEIAANLAARARRDAEMAPILEAREIARAKAEEAKKAKAAEKKAEEATA